MPIPLGALIGLGSSLLGGLFGGRKSRLEKQISSKINPVMENLINWSGEAMDARRAFYPLALKGISGATNFYSNLLSPNSNQALNELLGPQRTGINDAYGNLIQNAGRFGARGGGRTSGMAQFDWQRNRELMELVPQTRMMAAQGLAQTGGQAGNLSLDYGNQAINASSAVLNPALGGQESLAAQRQASGAQWGALGGKIGGLLGPVLSDWINNRQLRGAVERSGSYRIMTPWG